MASLQVSDYLNAVEHWENHTPDYATLLNTVGGGSNTDRAGVLRAVINIAARSPVAIAIVLQDDEDHVHIAHTPSIFPADPQARRPFDDRCIVLIGNDLATATPTS